MYTLAIPKGLKKRTLGYLKQQWVEFEEHPSMEGFFEVRFPGLDEEGFRDMVNKLRAKGVTMIGADEQLTERKIMKLVDLMNEQALGYKMKNFPLGGDEDPSKGFLTDPVKDILIDLRRLLEQWEDKTYDSPEERYISYFDDIQGLVDEYEAGMKRDYEDKKDDEAERGLSVDAPDRYNESIRKVIRKSIKKLLQ